MSQLALIDGDSWVYRCGFAAEKTKYLLYYEQGGGEDYKRFDSSKEMNDYAKTNGMSWFESWTRKEYEPLENCLQMVKTSLENTLDVLGNPDCRIYLSGRHNFRDTVYGEYKANRDSASRPKYFSDVREYMVAKWGAVVVDGIEADDAIGIAAMAEKQSIIVAVDKDLDQIPGQHYNWVKGESYKITPAQGMKFFYEQLLSGDPTDNIPGIDGIGPVKASKRLVDCRTPQDCARVVIDTYRAAGFDNDTLDRNATLVWIRRAEGDTHPLWRHLG